MIQRGLASKVEGIILGNFAAKRAVSQEKRADRRARARADATIESQCRGTARVGYR